MHTQCPGNSQGVPSLVNQTQSRGELRLGATAGVLGSVRYAVM